jgi:VanZ family protein
VLVIGSLLPEQAKVAIGTSTPEGSAVVVRIAWTHSLAHYAAFGSTVLILMTNARRNWQRHAALLATIALGIGIEKLQQLFYGSDFEMNDVRDDVFAACSVYLIWHVVRAWPNRRPARVETEALIP